MSRITVLQKQIALLYERYDALFERFLALERHLEIQLMHPTNIITYQALCKKCRHVPQLIVNTPVGQGAGIVICKCHCHNTDIPIKVR
jgi:hypothetical protein